jgi:hypothetical protein
MYILRNPIPPKKIIIVNIFCQTQINKLIILDNNQWR